MVTVRRSLIKPIERARASMDSTSGLFELFGFDDAARNLRRYRSGQGGTQNYSDPEIDQHEQILEAEDHSRSRFEIKTFTGNGGKPSLVLNSLKSGQTVTFQDHWNRSIIGQPDAVLGKSIDTLLDAALNPGTYLAFGRGEIRSSGDFTATRKGDNISLKGTVTNGFDTNNNENVFDFNPGQPGSKTARLLEAEQARTGNPEGAPFAMQFDRKQDVEAEIKVNPNGKLTLLKSKWGRIY